MMEYMYRDLDTINRCYGYFETEVFPMVNGTDIHEKLNNGIGMIETHSTHEGLLAYLRS
jgi:hypothetical protein